jgi:digeranylgeranylglycerophospholipid reductase
MKKISCDVLIVGASAAGLGAAIGLMKSNKKVVCIDKKERAGVPVNCAEGIGKFFVDILPIALPKKLLSWKVEGIAFYKDNLCLDKTGALWKGYSVDRKKIEKYFYNKSKKEINFFFGYELYGLSCKKDFLTTRLFFKSKKETICIEPKRVIAADGVDSKVIDLMNIPRRKKYFGEILNYEVVSKDLKKTSFEQIFLGDFAPTGYGFIFPKSKTKANVGIGCINPKQDMEKYFDAFLKVPFVNEQLNNMKVIKDKSKRAPFGDQLNKLVYGNVLFCGDAANHNYKPFVEGFLPSFISGYVSGKYVQTNKLKPTELFEKICDNLPGFIDNKELQKAMLFVFKKPLKERVDLLFLLSSGILDPKKVFSIKSNEIKKIMEKVNLKNF